MKVVTFVSGIPRSQTYIASSTSVYEADLEVSSTITAGTAVTLPSAETYIDVELTIFLNGARLENTYDYTYVGSTPRTQVMFTFDLYSPDRLVFRKEIG